MPEAAVACSVPLADTGLSAVLAPGADCTAGGRAHAAISAADTAAMPLRPTHPFCPHTVFAEHMPS